MIASVRGPVAAIAPGCVVVEVGGVGLTVQCAPSTIAGLRTGEQTQLATSLIVREDSLTLYGFADEDERQTFELLQTASGVGPRLAQAMLAVHSPEALRTAIAAGDEKALTAVPGIGKKGAQKLLVELRDRLGPPSGAAASAGQRAVTAPQGPAPWQEQLQAALTGLGYPPRDAEAAVSAVAPQAEEAQAAGRQPDTGMLLREALRTLGRGR